MCYMTCHVTFKILGGYVGNGFNTVHFQVNDSAAIITNEVILFGEGYGNKIQAVGSAYKPDGVDFILFDVCVGNNYQEREWVEQTALAFGCGVVPVVGRGTLEWAVAFVKGHHNSTLGTARWRGLCAGQRGNCGTGAGSA